MMRSWSLARAARRALVLGVLFAGCGGADRDASSSRAPVPPSSSPAVVASEAAKAAPVAAGPDAEASAADVMAAEASVGEVADAVPTVEADATEMGTFDAYAVPGADSDAITAERCRAACDNAKRVTLNELPADIAPTMREAIERAMTRDCPRRCVDRASIESVRCIESARTALEFAACPR